MPLYKTETGAGPTVVILHGLFGSSRNWGNIAQAMAGEARMVSFDLPNHGASPWVESMTYPAMAAAVAEEIAALGAPVTVLGHSMGGKVAMCLALTRPDLVARLMVIDIAPVPYRHGYSHLIHALLAAPVAGATRRSEIDAGLAGAIPDPALRGFLLQNLERGEDGYRWRPNLAGLDRAMADILDFPVFAEGTRYQGPVRVLAGARSDYVRDNGRAAIARLFPRARIENVDGAGHWLHAERPDVVIAALRGLLAETERASS